MAPALLLLLALHAQDPVRVGARLTDEEIHAGETTILRIDVETDGPRAQFRQFQSLPPGIEVVGTRDYDQRQFSLPGGTRRFITRELVLQARAPGRYRIPSLEVVVDGDVYATSSLLLTVTSAATRPRGETRGGEDGVMVRAWLDSDTVFVGQQVTLEVEALFSQDARMRLRRAPEYEAPNPPGFWVHELPDAGRPVRRSVGADVYEVQRFRRAFFPLSPGDYTIPPARLEYEMRRGLLYAPETRTLASEPLPLVVLPIPAEQPPSFNGAVGSYTVQARVEPATVPVGEAAVLTVEVSGVGNVKALPPPELPEIEGVDVFPPSQEAVTEARGTTIQGRKTFSWVLIPRQAGELEVPAIRYAYFDADAGGFETVAVAPLTLRASPASASGSPLAPATFRFLKTTPDPDPLRWVRSSWFGAVQALPLLLLIVALAWRRRQDRRGRVSIGGLRRVRRQRMKELEARVPDPQDREMFADAESFAREWLRQRLGLVPGTPVASEALRRSGVPDQTAAVMGTVLDRLASGRYSPTPPSAAERQALIQALARALERVDQAAPRKLVDAAGATAASAGVILLLALGAPATAAGQTGAATAGQTSAAVPEPGSQARDPAARDLFIGGLTAFQNGEYGASAEAFDRYISRAPRDPAGWYNLGTAYQRAGHPGYGIWAWLRTLRLNPRDRDARHNLRVAGVPPELVRRATPGLPLSTSELTLLLTLCWLAAGGAGALWLLRRGRAARWIGLSALAVAIALAGVWWTATREASTLIVLESATLRAAPALRAEPVTALEPGTGLIPVDRYGEWVRARTLRGAEGWIEETTTGPL